VSLIYKDDCNIRNMKKIIAQGAEAVLIQEKNKLVKDRIEKGYRHPELDKPIRRNRTKRESKILSKIKNIIPVPRVFDITENKIIMQFLKGKKLSDFLDKLNKKKALQICKKIGKNVAKLHEIGIIHGDLTTSNMIFQENQVFFIDFGLAFHSLKKEDKAVDLHLLKEALKSKHFKSWQSYFKATIDSYKNAKNLAVLAQLEKVELRGRYKQRKRK